jgi:hypothetical protein
MSPKPFLTKQRTSLAMENEAQDVIFKTLPKVIDGKPKSSPNLVSLEAVLAC